MEPFVGEKHEACQIYMDICVSVANCVQCDVRGCSQIVEVTGLMVNLGMMNGQF